MLSPEQIADLLRAASRRGLRARELAEHVREAYSTGPRARAVMGDGQCLYFEGTVRAHQEGLARSPSPKGAHAARRSRQKIPIGTEAKKPGPGARRKAREARA